MDPVIVIFGFGIGLLIGPLAVSMFLSLLSMYHRDFSPLSATNGSRPGASHRGG